MVNLLGTNFVFFAPTDVEKSLWFFQMVSLFSKGLMTILFIYYFIFYGKVVAHSFFSSAAVNVEGGLLDSLSW